MFYTVFVAGVFLAAGLSVETIEHTPLAEEPPAALHACPPAEVLVDKAGWELVPQAVYAVSQTPGDVLVKAFGENPTAGYEVRLALSPEKIYPPQYLLYRKKPEGMAAEVITPFEICVSFKADRKIDFITITDAAGQHRVKVDQARD